MGIFTITNSKRVRVILKRNQFCANEHIKQMIDRVCFYDNIN